MAQGQKLKHRAGSHNILERQPWAASSRNAVIERCSRIINGNFIADKDILPRSGPWSHSLVEPHKALPVTRGRTEHPDAWRVGFVEGAKKEYKTMAREEWDAWHYRHSVGSRQLPGGDGPIKWQVPAHIIKGNGYLPMGTIETISRSSSLSSAIAKSVTRRSSAANSRGITAYDYENAHGMPYSNTTTKDHL